MNGIIGEYTSKMSLRTEIRDGFHHLADMYYTNPFGLMRFDKRSAHDPWLRYMIRSSTPGIMAGDFYEMSFKVAKGTNLGLETQAYSRIHSMKPGGFAKQTTEIEVEEDAMFQYIPHPTSPHKDSVYEAVNTLHIAKTSRVIWGEVITCGRKLYGEGEVFEFKEFKNYTRIFLDGHLIFKDRLYMKPSEMDLTTMGQWEDYTHQATIFIYDQQLEEDHLLELLEKALKDDEGVEYGITTTVGGGIVIRIVGHGGEQLYNIAKRFEYSILDEIIEPI